jgi:RNA polymerase sigma factor (sigma-70 family)
VPVFEKDPQLVQRFRAGHRDALARVYRFYFDDVYRLGQHGFVTSDGRRGGRLESEADRLDFVQDVFLKAFAFEARVSYDPQRPYRPFLLRIARNLRVDLARQLGREPSAGKLGVCDYLHIDELVEWGGAIPALDTSLHWQQLVEQTASIVGDLPPEVRDVARLRFVEELSQVEIASKLGKTRRHVRTLESRLLQSVRRGLVRAGFGGKATEK